MTMESAGRPDLKLILTPQDIHELPDTDTGAAATGELEAPQLVEPLEETNVKSPSDDHGEPAAALGPNVYGIHDHSGQPITDYGFKVTRWQRRITLGDQTTAGLFWNGIRRAIWRLRK